METLTDCLLLWQQILNPEDRSKARTFGQWRSIWDLERLNECLEMDATGLTSAMVLLGEFEGFVTDWAFSYRDLLNGQPASDREYKLCRRLESLLTAADIQEPIAAFKGRILAGLKHYNARGEVFELATDSIKLGEIRRDALRSFRDLDVHQFAQGKAVDKVGKYNPNVYEFLNINSALNAIIAAGQTGITLALIRDSDGEDAFSFFALVAWNGGTLTVLTDKRGWVHPAQKSMVRCVGREASEQIAKNRFPYQLAGIRWSEDGKHAWKPKRQGLISWQFKHQQLSAIRDLEPDQVIWLSMLFELIAGKYFAKNVQKRKLSFTAEMGLEAIEAQPQRLGVLVEQGRRTLEPLPMVPAESLTTKALADAGQWENKPTGFNDWLADRYAGKITTEMVNLVSDDRGLIALPSNLPRGMKGVLTRKSNRHRWSDEPARLIDELCSAMPTEFGTLAQLLRDQQWAARYNQAKIVDRMAKEEFEKRGEAVAGWFAEKVDENRAVLIEAALVGSFVVDSEHVRSFGDTGTTVSDRPGSFKPSGPLTYRKVDICQKWKYVESSQPPYRNVRPVHINGGIQVKEMGGWRYPYEVKKHLCCLADGHVRARVFVSLIPHTPAEVAALCGCKVSKLPIFLRHYYTSEPYNGNEILDRCDPMDWIVQNHWKELALSVKVCFSMREFKKHRRRLGLPDIAPGQIEKHKMREWY